MCDSIEDTPAHVTVKYTCHKGICEEYDERIVDCLSRMQLKVITYDYDHMTGIRQILFK